MPIIEDVEGVGQLEVFASNVSFVFVIAELQAAASLANITLIASGTR
jgi:hypothetical protein